MSWVKDCVRMQQERTEPATRDVQVQVHPPEQRNRWKPTWDRINAAIRNDLQEFNEMRGAQFQPSWGDFRVQIIPKQPPFDTVVLSIDEETGKVLLTCPISHPGIPRRGTFRLSGERISSYNDFVGEPKPPTLPMTPEEFSEFILRPVLFPDLK
jgi:hypothetical protein